MRKNEIKRTVEQVISVEYIANDGTVFAEESECIAYEKSARFIVSNKLKRLAKQDYVSEYDLFDYGCEDNRVEIFNVENQEDLDNLKKYVYLKMTRGKETEEDLKRIEKYFSKFTYGHEIIIYWDYDECWFWAYGDGSLKGYFDYIQEKYNKIIGKEEKKEEVQKTQ